MVPRAGGGLAASLDPASTSITPRASAVGLAVEALQSTTTASPWSGARPDQVR